MTSTGVSGHSFTPLKGLARSLFDAKSATSRNLRNTPDTSQMRRHLRAPNCLAGTGLGGKIYLRGLRKIEQVILELLLLRPAGLMGSLRVTKILAGVT